MKFKDFISGDDTLNLIQDILKQNNYTFTVKKNKIIVSTSDRFGTLQNIVKLFSQLKAVYNPEGSGSSLGRVEIKSPQNKTFYIFAKPVSGSGLTANRGNQFEIDFSKALESYINGDSVDKKYLDAIEEIESISKKDGFYLSSISNDGALNQKRPFVFTPNGIVCGSTDFDIGKTVTDITSTYSNSKTEYKRYLSLKFGSSVTFANIGVSKYLKSSEIQEGEIKNSQGKALLNMFCIDEKMFCDAFNSYIERAERVRKAKKIQVDVTNELKNSREFSDFIKSVIGYGYILVHKIGSNIHCLDMTKSVLDKFVEVKKAVVLYPSGDAKRVDILVELNGLKLKFNFRNKSGGIYPSHLLADYSLIRKKMKFKNCLNKSVRPKTKAELMYIIDKTIKEQGFNCDLNFIDTSKITDMSGLFADSEFAGDISNWNVSNVEDMSWMFRRSEFNGDISNWDVSNVKDMSYMFTESNFNGDISKWDVSNVRDISGMFYKSTFNGDISQWDVSKVKDMEWMFSGSAFNGDISKWNVSNVKYMTSMFADSEFTGDISKWDVSNVENMRGMFADSEFTGDISKWNISNVRNICLMFRGSKFNGDISNWDVSNVRDISGMFLNSIFNGDISKWNVSNVENMQFMFCKSMFDGDISNWDVSNVIDMEAMFYDSKFNGDISKWNVSNVKDMEWMFKGSKFNRDISNWDVSNVRDITEMFADSAFNDDISKWNVSKVEDMIDTFKHSPLEGNEPDWYNE